MSDYGELALCRDTDPEIFFPVDERPRSEGVKDAKAICAVCPARVECLMDSLARGDEYGVFGGLAPAERRALRARRRVARTA